VLWLNSVVARLVSSMASNGRMAEEYERNVAGWKRSYHNVLCWHLPRGAEETHERDHLGNPETGAKPPESKAGVLVQVGEPVR
jgi:hypothetical protein